MLVVCVECSSLSGLTQNYKIFYDLNDRLTFLTFKHLLLDQYTLCVSFTTQFKRDETWIRLSSSTTDKVQWGTLDGEC